MEAAEAQIGINNSLDIISRSLEQSGAEKTTEKNSGYLSCTTVLKNTTFEAALKITYGIQPKEIVSHF